MPLNIKRDQLRALVLKPGKETVNGKSLVQLLQDAAAKDDVEFLYSLQDACHCLEEEEQKEKLERRGRANNTKPDEETKSAHERYAQLLNPSGLKDTTLLILAIQAHSTKVLRFLLEDARSMVDVEKEGTARLDGEERIPGTTPLWTAAALGHLDMVNLLLEAGANINHGSATNSTPLRAACYDGFLKVVEVLVKHGASVNMCNKYGSGPLHLAGFRGFPKLAAFLLKNGADINCTTTSEREAPLHHAGVMGHVEVVEVLLDYHADCDKKTLHGSIPLTLSAAAGEAGVVDVFMKRTPVSLEDRVAAHLLLGAAFVDKHNNIPAAAKAWNAALEVGGKEGLLAQGPLKPIAAYRKVNLPTSAKDIFLLTSDRDRTLYFALAIREHILGPKHPDTIHYVRLRGAHFADEERYSEALSLWSRCVEMEIMSANGSANGEVHQTLIASTELLGEQVASHGTGNVRALYELALNNLRRLEPGGSDSGKTVRILLTLLHLWMEVTRAAPSEWEGCQKAAIALNSLQIVLRKGYYAYTPLHLACDSKTFVHGPKSRKNVCKFPAPTVVRLLLETGASVHQFDCRGNTPLHIACMSDSVACVAEMLPYVGTNTVLCENEAGKLPAELASSDKIKSLLKSIASDAS